MFPDSTYEHQRTYQRTLNSAPHERNHDEFGNQEWSTSRDYYDQQAKERQKQGKENLPYPSAAGQARDQAGKAVGVSGKSVDYATKVLKHGTPELVKAVDEGRMAVTLPRPTPSGRPTDVASTEETG